MLNEDEELWTKYINDETYYELTDKSDDSEDDLDEDYDSAYFCQGDSDMDEIESKKYKKCMATCKGKYIAKWAEKKSLLKKLLIHQDKVLNPDKIFGRLTTDTILLNEVFDDKRSLPDIRGSSANWKNEYWTPLEPDKSHIIIRDEKDPVENLDGKFKLSQTYPSPEFKCESNPEDLVESSYDILEL